MWQPFQIVSATANATLVCSGTTGSIDLPGITTPGNRAVTVRIVNLGPNEAFVAFGSSGVTATAGGAASASPDGSMSIPAGLVDAVRIDVDATHIAGITASGGAATLRISVGAGI